MNNELVFLAGSRTPFCAFGGTLRDINPTDLCVSAAKEAVNKAKIEATDIDHIIIGNVLHSAVDSIYTPRHTGLKLGVPMDRPALGINRLCGSGFQVIIEALHQIQAGDSQVALVGGVENMSLSPYVLRGARFGLRLGHSLAQDSMTEALTDSYAEIPMGITAENLAEKYSLTREVCDEFALNSQKKAKRALDEGIFKEEISEFLIPDKKSPTGFKSIIQDEHPKPETTSESLGRLKAVFKKQGVVTAGNASGIVDGSAMIIVASHQFAQNRSLKPIGRLIEYSVVGCDPHIMGIGPVPAIQKLLLKSKKSLSEIDLFEINEAFAPQCLSVQRELNISDDKLNVNGGAIAIGHPLAASGSRIVLHLLLELKRRGKRLGIGAACIGGGQGIAVLVEAL